MTGAGTQYDQTEIAHNTTSQRVTLNPSQPSNLQSGQTISESNLENFLSSLASSYTTERANTYTLSKTICHSSCHTNAHLQRKKIMINTIVPIELKDLKKYFEDKTETYLIDYEKSKLKGAQFLTYLSNLDVPYDLSNYDDELLKEYFESSMLVNIPLLEKPAMIVLFEHKGSKRN